MTLALFHLFIVIFLVLLSCFIKYGKTAWLIARYNTSSKEESLTCCQIRLVKGCYIFRLAAD